MIEFLKHLLMGPEARWPLAFAMAILESLPYVFAFLILYGLARLNEWWVSRRFFK